MAVVGGFQRMNENGVASSKSWYPPYGYKRGYLFLRFMSTGVSIYHWVTEAQDEAVLAIAGF